MDLNSKIENFYKDKKWETRERNYFYASEVGSCERELFMKFKQKEDKPMKPRIYRVLENGNFVHQRYMKMFAEMGMLIAAEVDTPKNSIIHGRADCIISNGKDIFVVDIKSVSMWSFNNMAEPVTKDKTQLLVYMYYFNIKKGILLYECKNTQNIKTFEINLDIKFVENLIDNLKELQESISKDLKPDCVGSKEKCQWCDFKTDCDKVIK